MKANATQLITITTTTRAKSEPHQELKQIHNAIKDELDRSFEHLNLIRTKTCSCILFHKANASNEYALLCTIFPCHRYYSFVVVVAVAAVWLLCVCVFFLFIRFIFWCCLVLLDWLILYFFFVACNLFFFYSFIFAFRYVAQVQPSSFVCAFR